MMLACKSLPKVSKSFTLIEILATIAIMAVLVTVAGFFIVGYVQYSKETADRQTLAVLNDALNRYKCEGGDISALTASAPISHVLAKLKATVQWGGPNGVTHQFLKTDFTVPGRSLFAAGNRHQYRFTKYNTYELEAGGVSTAESSGFTPSPGVGYLANDGSTNYEFTCETTTGYFAIKPQGGNASTYASSSDPNIPGAYPSITFWSCVGPGDITPSGSITFLNANAGDIGDGNLAITDFNVSGLSGLQYLGLGHNPLTSVSLNNLVSLSSLNISNTQISTLEIAGSPNLLTLTCFLNSLTSLTLSDMENLEVLDCSYNQLDAAALNSIYSSLPDRTSTLVGSIYVANNPGTSSDDVSIATAKHWTVNGS